MPCGHAFSGTAIKEVSGEKCLTCETEYASNDIIPILPIADTDIARLSLRVKTLQEKGLSHSLKKASSGGKKRKKRDEPVETTAGTTPILTARTHQTSTPRTSTPVNGKQDHDTASINNASTASLTAKVLEEQERAKKRKLENKNVQSLFSSHDQSKPIGKSSDFMTRGYSVPTQDKR